MPSVPRTRIIAPPSDTPDWGRQLIQAVNRSSDAVSALDGGLSLSKNFNGELRKLDFVMPAEPPFTPFVTNSGGGHSWTAASGYSVASSMMLPGGIVVLRGAVLGVAMIINFGITTLPEGQTPAGTIDFPVATGTAAAVVRIAGGGVLTYLWGPTGTPTVSLDTVRFHASPAGPPSQFTGSNWPILLKHDLGRVAGLIPLGCALTSRPASNVGQGLPYLDWQDVGDGRVRLNGAWGLQWGARYTMQVLLVPTE